MVGNARQVDEVREAAAAFGYTEDRWAEGEGLLQQAEDLVRLQKQEYGEQHEASAALAAAWDEADKVYMKTLKVARMVLADDVQAITALKLAGARDLALDQLDRWLAELRTILKVALAEEPDLLETAGISAKVGGRPRRAAG